MTRFDEQELKSLINGCIRKELESQQKLYKRFYGFAMGKCLRYASNRYDASEILNDGFLKVFKNIHKYDYAWPFHSWLGKIMSNTAIDHYRAELRHSHTQELTIAEDVAQEPNVYQSMNYQDLLKIVQQLPASYRTVFNLFAIDGYSHEEIGQILSISVGTSKSNLFKARQKLQKALQHCVPVEREVRDGAEEGGKIVSIQKKFSEVGSIVNGGLEP
ncbi:sigma-70 family RNA polymerase sigma factor [Pedobacter sp. HMF7056]|uniref:Sigma-70 family RNA polymerase sigma factor n=1 Tax=Hufsiella ginkgonis TaxID=2695274 RepID=A0A7K1XTS8_9SPHI|nr:sigma-70 family RNA polymerase sigma factor [Hufsiella ginkgonis]